MAKQIQTQEQKRLDTDIWIISLVTFGFFLCYAVLGEGLMAFVSSGETPILMRLLLSAGVQFGISGLGITIVCTLRKERFSQFGLTKNNLFKAIGGTVICFIPSICYVLASGKYRGYQPLNIMITDDVLASSMPMSIFGMALIAVVWGFFEGFNYAVICEKIDMRYPSKNWWLDIGAIACAVICVLFHPISLSPWGIADMLTSAIAIYGMLMVRKATGNSWGCVFAFCFIWNAI